MNAGVTRRRFLRRSAAGTAAFSLGGSALLQLGAAAHAQSADGYRALVCVLLAGGADSYNMLVPSDDDGYAEYASIRSDLALERASLTPLGGTHQGGRSFGLHPGLAPLAPLFDAGELAWVTNVGSLAEPTRRRPWPPARRACPSGSTPTPIRSSSGRRPSPTCAPGPASAAASPIFSAT